MASRPLLQLFTLSIIFTNQIEARTFNNRHDLLKNQQYDLITTPVNKRSVKANTTDSNNTVLTKKIYSHFDQYSATNAESRNNILSRNKNDHKHKHKGNEEADSDKSQAEQQSDDNLESNAKITSNRIELSSSDSRKHFPNEGTSSEETNQVNSIKRKLVAEVMAQTIAIEKVKQEGEEKLEPNDESLQNYVEKYPTVKPVRRQKQLTVKPSYTKIRKTQATREKKNIPKITHKRYSEIENEICKTKHCDYENYRSFEKISREHDVYKLKRRDEFKTASKRNNKNKIYNMKMKHCHNKNQRPFKTEPQGKAQYKLKHPDIEKPVLSNKISEENDIYVRKHKDDFVTVDETVTDDNYQRKHIDDSASVEESLSKQVNPKYKPKFSNHFQKKKHRDKKVRKVRDTDKTKHNSKIKKHDSEKVISKQEKYKPKLKEYRDSVFETHTNIRKGDKERNANSGDNLIRDDADIPTIENQDENETLESYEELFKQHDLLDKPKLPFYVSSTTKRTIKEIFKKQPKKLGARKNEKETDILLHDFNTVLKGNSNSINQNNDLNTTISRLASSKVFDFITDRLAGKMLKKLENSLASKNNLRTKEVNPEKVEQFDILFKKNGNMVMMGPEYVKEKEGDENGFREAFYP